MRPLAVFVSELVWAWLSGLLLGVPVMMAAKAVCDLEHALGQGVVGVFGGGGVFALAGAGALCGTGKDESQGQQGVEPAGLGGFEAKLVASV
jgi:hypothetical protein